MATCKIKEKYDWIECDRSSLEGDPEGLCILHSRQADKDKEGEFTEAVQAKLASEDYDFRIVFFPGEVNFSKHEFKKDADFFGAIFSGEAHFRGATFSGAANFFGATFSGAAGFSWATFSGAAGFSWATFSEDARFFEATFSGAADFSGATFSKVADFSGATFSGAANFIKPTFSGAAGFSDAIFSGAANFPWATFSGETFFGNTKFQQSTSFSYCQIKNQLILDTINPAPQGQPRETFQADFSHIRFYDQGRLRFQDLSLAHATLGGTDLRRGEFNNVDWCPFRGRQAINDEVRLYEIEVAWYCHLMRKKWLSWQESSPWLARLVKTCAPLAESKTFARIRERSLYARNLFSLEHGKDLKAEKPSDEQYARVEECYRYLKLNYEGAGDFKKAGDFHYGEMEMHRRASKWRWLPIYWYNLYRVLSGYGERPLRALLVLAGLLVVFTWWFSGGEGNLPPAWSWGRFWQDCLYILQKATFQRPERQLSSNWGQWLATLSPLLLPGQAALFLLALRNRLGRRR